jgi:hypothetical protein
VAALEINSVVTPAIANLIREAKTFRFLNAAGWKEIRHANAGRRDSDLLNKKMISPEDAYSRCIEKAPAELL